MIKIALSTTLCASLAMASTTMCFKKDHLDPSNIESIPLEGGECKGMFSVSDMQKQGYEVDDIKITVGSSGMNYMYVFTKQSVVIGNANTKVAPGTQVLTKEQLRSYLSELKEEEAQEEKRKMLMGSISNGKVLYESTCKECHGAKGEISAYNVAKPLNTFSYEDMDYAISEYDNGKRKGSLAIIMQPYASSLTEQKIKDITAYLQSLK